MSLDPNKLNISCTVDLKPKIEINKGGLDYYTKEEIDEKLDNITGGVNVLPEAPELTEKSVSQLYRFINDDESVDNLYMVNKNLEVISVQSRTICERNGVLLNIDTLLDNFENTYIDIFGEAIPETVENIYTNLYTIDGEKINMIRIGTKNPGTIVLTNLQNVKIKVVAGQYYSYNGVTGEKNYENGIMTINGVEHILTQEPTAIEVEITDGTLTLSCGGSSSTGRGFLYGFKQLEEETIIHYNLENIVSEAMLDYAINDVIDYIDQNVTSRVESLEQEVQQFASEVDKIDDDIRNIKNSIGGIQFNNCNELPVPREGMLDKVFRLNGEFYQCLAEGTGGSDTYSFAVTGTSEVTINNWNDFANGVGTKFKETFSLESIEKFYRNNTEVKFGSSSVGGSLVLIEEPTYTNTISFEVRGWSATKVSIFYYRIENTEDSELVIEDSVELTGDVDFHTIDLPIGFVVNKITFGSLKDGATDARVCVKSMTINTGNVEYYWSKIPQGLEDKQDKITEETDLTAKTITLGEVTLTEEQLTKLLALIEN